MISRRNSIQNIQYFVACLFFVSLNFEVFSPIIPEFSVAKMVAYLYLGVSLLTPNELFLVNKIKQPVYAVLFMFFFMVLSSILHLSLNSSVFNSTILLNIIMFWLLINHQRRDKRVFNDGLLWYSISSFAIGMFYYFNIGVSLGDDMRVSVFHENSNNLGVKMGVGILCMFIHCLSYSPQKPINRPWLLVLIIPMLLLMFATGSRVSLLVIGLGSALFVLLKPTKQKRWKLLWFVVGAIALYYGYQLVMQQEILMMRMERTLEEGSTSGRDIIWEKYMYLIRQNPILGVGFTGAQQYAVETLGKSMSPHNVFIEVALYSGIIGFICFSIFIWSLYRDAWLYYRKRKILGPLILNVATMGLLISAQALGFKLFWVLAAYAISYRVSSEERNDSGFDDKQVINN